MGHSEDGGAIIYAERLLLATREELTRADGKSSLLLATAGVVIGILVAAMVGGTWTPYHLDNRIEWIWWLGSCAVVAGVGALGAAVYPRGLRPGATRPTVVYFGDIAAIPTVQEVKMAIRVSAYDDLDFFAVQLTTLSRIVRRKYRLIAAGMVLLAAGIVLCAGASLLNGVT